MTKHDGIAFRLALIGVTVLAALLSSCFSTARPELDLATPLTSPPPVTREVVTPAVLDNGWYQYQDAEVGYSFSYPPETRVKIGRSRFGNHSAQLQFYLPDEAGYQGMVIRVEANPQDLPIEAMLAQLYERSAQELAPEALLAQVEVISVAGQPAIKTSILPINAEFAVIFLYNNKVYTLAPVHGPTATTVDPEALDLFYQILETFKVNP